MAKNANRWLYIILLVAVLSSFAVIIFDLAPKKYWWLVLVTINLAASVSTVYFVKSFGVKVGLSLTLIIAVLGYVFCSSARLLPFVRENDLFSHYYYFTIACLWVVVMALSKALTQNMSIAFRTMFTFLMILFIEYCMMPVMALFEHYKRGHTEYLFYAIQLSGYLVITGFTMIF
ncbi:hypothetical protein [Kurthia sibirica]|uniref:Uncharacterized protein n=1 Tax=Kurthia sibirica TaxID=202750 RepID=A0A2U3ALU9_9BACL|nr:hypothetical protein [Kurthia sibirica]PWI25523.1 hypothetical protein DEX24_07910 [Kurthia sibirica]GEK33899.1 hypothetical protein KSI01_14320 [Kurthia sibirica]